jgi:hypothetical protein
MNRGNFILNRLFSNSVHSIRRLAANDSEAKAMYRFLQLYFFLLYIET